MKRVMLQAYVKGSNEAIRLYKEAFDAKLSNEVLNDDGTYLHAELEVDGYTLAISETDMEVVQGNTMQFCFHYGKGHEEAIQKAYDVLKQDSFIIHELGPCFFSPLMASFIDKFGVSWCLFE